MVQDTQINMEDKDLQETEITQSDKEVIEDQNGKDESSTETMNNLESSTDHTDQD